MTYYVKVKFCMEELSISKIILHCLQIYTCYNEGDQGMDYYVIIYKYLMVQLIFISLRRKRFPGRFATSAGTGQEYRLVWGRNISSPEWGWDEVRFAQPRPLGESCRPDPGRIPWESHFLWVYLVERCPDTKGGSILTWDRSGRCEVEDSNRNSESPNGGGDKVPWHPLWLLHCKGHGGRLHWSQYDSSAGGYEVRVPI